MQEGTPWTSLLEALSWGTSFNPAHESFTAPYFADADIEGGEYIVTGHGVRLRDAPLTGRVIRKLSFEVVRVLSPAVLPGFAADKQWAQVRTDLAESGYIFGAFLKSPADERFVFQRIDGVWKLSAYGYGD